MSGSVPSKKKRSSNASKIKEERVEEDRFPEKSFAQNCRKETGRLPNFIAVDYVDIGATTLLIRGYDPYEDAIDYGRDLIPLVRDVQVMPPARIRRP